MYNQNCSSEVVVAQPQDCGTRVVVNEPGFTAVSYETAEIADRLLALGFPIMPLRPVFFAHEGARGECNCSSPQCEANGGGKHPCYAGWQTVETRGQDPRFTDPRTWINAPAFGIGIVTGLELRRGKYLFIVDVDVADSKPGRESLAHLQQKLGQLPETMSVITGSGGLQFYFVTDAPLPSTARGLAPGIDTRGAGGYGVAPPSMHKTGNRYAWMPGRAPWEVEVASLPEPWVNAVRNARRIERAPRAPAPVPVSRFAPEKAKRHCVGVINHPAWRWAVENPDDVHRMTWIGFATNLIAACDGHAKLLDAARRAFHELSKGHQAYAARQTDAVFDEAVRFVSGTGGPYLWSTMENVPLEFSGNASTLVEDVRRADFQQIRR